MDAETLKALDASIEKWAGYETADVRSVRLGVYGCPLCQIFHERGENTRNGPANGCAGCPVMAKTGFECCVRTPYYAACQKLNHAFRAVADDRPKQAQQRAALAWRKAARKMTDFLRGLRPSHG